MIFSPRISVIMAAALMAAGCDSDLSNSVTNTNTATTDYDSTVTAPVSTSSRSTTTTTTHTSATPTTGGAWVIVLDDALTTGVTTGEAAGGEFTESGYFLLSGAYLHYDTPCQQAIRVEFDAMGFREDTAPTLTNGDMQADAPACATCGAIMERAGSCYKCPNCGSTSGCS